MFLYRYFKRFTMDSIWNCAFGLDVDVQNNPNNIYYTKSEEHFASLVNFPFLYYIISMN